MVKIIRLQPEFRERWEGILVTVTGQTHYVYDEYLIGRVNRYIILNQFGKVLKDDLGSDAAPYTTWFAVIYEG